MQLVSGLAGHSVGGIVCLFHKFSALVAEGGLGVIAVLWIGIASKRGSVSGSHLYEGRGRFFDPSLHILLVVHVVQHIMHRLLL